MRHRLIACMVAAASLSATGGWAHHSFAQEFDVKRPVTIRGKVSKVQLINPHSWIHVDVVDETGNTVTWMIEGGSPNALIRRGITRDSVPLGAELVIRGYGARDGTHKAVGRDITFADGRELFFGGTRPESAAE